jgi:hypothetical protein
MAILQSQRHLFDIPEDVAYFNCAYNSPQLNASRDRLRLGADSKSHPWERIPDDFFRDAETIRGLASAIFGGDADGYEQRTSSSANGGMPCGSPPICTLPTAISTDSLNRWLG